MSDSEDEDDQLEEELADRYEEEPDYAEAYVKEKRSSNLGFATQLMTPASATEREGHPFLQDALPEPREVLKTIQELYDMMKPTRAADGTILRAPKIDVNPPWQRASVWSFKQSSNLIKSIYENFHIPQLVFNVFAPDLSDEVPIEETDWDDFYFTGPTPLFGDDEDVKPDINALVRTGRRARATAPYQRWTCNDGKQRLTALKRFKDGLIPLTIEGTGSRKTHWYYREPVEQPKTKSWKLLSNEAKREFDNRKLRLARYDNLDDEQEQELFQRVQEGVSLSTYEKVMATPGQLRDWAVALRDIYCPPDTADDPHPDTFYERVCTLANGVDFQAMLFVTLNYLDGPKYRSDSAIKTAIKASPSEQDELFPNESARENVETILKNFRRLTLKKRSIKWESITRKRKAVSGQDKLHQVFTDPKLLAPVEFMWIPVILENFQKLRDGKLLEIIEIIRNQVNTAHKGEVKLNVKVADYMNNLIQNFDLGQLTDKYNDDGTKKGDAPAPRPAPAVPAGTPRSRTQTSSRSSPPKKTPSASTSQAVTSSKLQPAKAAAENVGVTRNTTRGSPSPIEDDIPLRRRALAASAPAPAAGVTAPQSAFNGTSNPVASGSGLPRPTPPTNGSTGGATASTRVHGAEPSRSTGGSSASGVNASRVGDKRGFGSTTGAEAGPSKRPKVVTSVSQPDVRIGSAKQKESEMAAFRRNMMNGSSFNDYDRPSGASSLSYAGSNRPPSSQAFNLHHPPDHLPSHPPNHHYISSDLERLSNAIQNNTHPSSSSGNTSTNGPRALPTSFGGPASQYSLGKTSAPGFGSHTSYSSSSNVNRVPHGAPSLKQQKFSNRDHRS